MSCVKLQRRRDAPELHEQIAAQIRRAIAEGEATPGERLPAARDLAAELGVNRNTVLRALRTLRDEGLVDFSRGRGVTVAGHPGDGLLVAHARDFVELGRRLGYGVEELVDVVDRVGHGRVRGGAADVAPAGLTPRSRTSAPGRAASTP